MLFLNSTPRLSLIRRVFGAYMPRMCGHYTVWKTLFSQPPQEIMVEARRSSPVQATTTAAASSWWRQFSALTYKSCKVLWHRRISLATYALSPSLAVIILYILFATVGVDHSKPKLHDDIPVSVPSTLTPCIVLDANHDELSLRSFSPQNSTSQTLRRCITLAYVPDTSTRATAVMQEVASSVNLRYGSDVLEFSSAESLSGFMFQNPGHVDFVVVFGPDDLLSYEIWFNETYTSHRAPDAFEKVDPMLGSLGVSGRLLALQKSVDAALIKAQDQSLALDFSLKLGAFTDIKNNKASSKAEPRVGESNGCGERSTKVRNQNVIGFVGAALIATGVGISAIVVLLTLVSEKQNRLTGKLRQMGMMESAHILSWTFVFVVLAFISSLLAAITMKLVSISHELLLFKQASFGVLFVTLFVFQIAMIGVALIIAALFMKPAFIIIISSTLFLGILFSTLWMSAITITDLYETDDSGKCFRTSNPYSSIWQPHKPSHFYEFLIFWFPWISYGRVMTEIFAVTKLQKSFSFQDLGTRRRFINSDTFTIYSPPALSSSLEFMFGLFIVSLPLTWYLSQALAGRMNGRRRWYFPLQSGYWGFAGTPSAYTKGDTFAEEREKSEREGSLRVFKLSKSYKGGTALREVSLTMQHGEVFALLGHNGAGKTTLINVLTGLTDATYGEAYFSGYSFKSNMAHIQSLCGICPQFDAVWEELNAEDHLHVCAAMQGLHGKEAADEITRVLEAVDLLQESKSRTTTFSGGMKRRLSVCMAVLGDRKRLIFLDEPTTGVDTMNKKRVWQLIEKLKEDKIVVLTTHNMEEADALGDKIAILHQGSLKAAGSSLFLKKEFGSGYQISMLLSSADDAPEVESIVKRVIPGAKIVQSAAGNLRVSLNHNSALAIPKLLAELRASLPGKTEPSPSSSMLKEWGISNTTLEEVFLRLSAQSELQVTEENAESDGENLCLICGLRKAEAVTLYTQSGIAVKVPNAICLSCAVTECRISDENTSGNAEFIDDDDAAGNEDDAKLPEVRDPYSPKQSESAAAAAAVINIQEPADENPQQELKAQPGNKSSLFRSQLRAMFYKNFKLNLAEKKSFIFYIVLLLVYVLLMKFFGGSFTPTQDFSSGSPTLCPGRFDLVDDGHCSAQQFLDDLSDSKLSWAAFAPQVLGSSSSSARVNATPGVWFTTGGSLQLGFSNQPGVQLRRVQGDDINSLFISGQESLQRNATPAYQIEFSTCRYAGAGAQRDLLYVASDISAANSTFDSLFPSSGVAWSVQASRTDHSGVQVSSTVRYKSSAHSYDAETIWIRNSNQTSGSCFYYPGSTSYKNLVPFSTAAATSSGGISPATALAINSISNSILQALLPGSSTGIKTSLRTYPSLKFISGSGDGDSVSSSTFALMFAITGISVFFSNYVSRLVMERETGLMRMMTIAGMKPAAYWLGNYLYDFILSVAQAAIFFIIGRIVGSSFTRADPILATVIILVWAHSLNSMAALTSGLFRSQRAASFFAVIGIIVCAASCTFVNFKYKRSSSMPLGAAIFPPLALARILFLLFSDSRTHELVADLVVLFMASTVLYIIGVFINQARASPDAFKMFRKSSKAPISSQAEDTTGASKGGAFDDLVQEVEKVRKAPSGALAIKTEKLRKVYPTRSGRAVKVAVDDLTLGLEYGEIFGLLGANGAGKTTALSMISGSLAPSSGVIEIGGKSPGNVLENQLSICPQTDVVWKDLSVWNHFMFYAYLKGLSSAQARAAIQRIAADLSLNGDSFHKKASSLSGGQLRRLSFGVSLVGSPSILLMDEITTGLDPASRTTIWEVVKKQSNAGRLILLTTHSMEEADTLCTRIGIMSHGQMKCLGAPLNLKNRYSTGYTLTIVSDNVSGEEQGAGVVSLIQRAAPDATQIYSWRRVRKYSIKSFDLKFLFQLLEDDSNKHRHGIREWQIEQTTLQDVFLKVSEEPQ